MLETTYMGPQMADPHLTIKIVQSYVRHHTIGAGQVSELIASVHGALSRLGRPSHPEEALAPAVPVRQSVRHDYVVCLDCGYRGKMLRRHIGKRHGLSPQEYLTRWGLRTNHPLTAPGYTEHCSARAKQSGLGRKTGAGPSRIATPAAAANVDPKSEAKPGRRRSTRSSKSNVAQEAATAPVPTKKTRSRARAS